MEKIKCRLHFFPKLVVISDYLLFCKLIHHSGLCVKEATKIISRTLEVNSEMYPF